MGYYPQMYVRAHGVHVTGKVSSEDFSIDNSMRRFINMKREIKDELKDKIKWKKIQIFCEANWNVTLNDSENFI